jgi:hypothetical protein
MPTGRGIPLTGFTYPTAAQASLIKLPVDTFNIAMAALAKDAGITRVFDPTFSWLVDPTRFSTGFAADLASTDSFVASGSPAITLGTDVNTNPVLDMVQANAPLIVSGSVKNETSFSLMVYVEQTSGDQAVTGNKVIVSAGVPVFYLRNTGAGSTYNVVANGNIGTNFTIAAGGHILAISYDAVSKGISIRDSADQVLYSATLGADPANGTVWSLGNIVAGGTAFDGRIGGAIFCNKALHIAANDVVRLKMQALMRAKYGL